MKFVLAATIVVMIKLLNVAVAADLYKCVGADGSVGFQDQPCASDEKEEPRQSGPKLITTEVDGVKMTQVPIPGVGDAVVPVFESMTLRVRNHGSAATTLVLKARPGAEPMELHMTLFANRADEPYNIISAREYLRTIDPNLVRHRYNYGERWNMEMSFTDATVHSWNQTGPTRLGEPAPLYTTTSVGFAKHPKVIAWIVIQNNGGTSDGLRQALKVVNALHIADTKNGVVIAR